MSNIIGKVASLAGEFIVKRANGVTSEILKGDEIYEGDIVSGAKDGSDLNSIVVTLEDGSDLVMFGDESQLFDASLMNEPFAENETITETETMQTLIDENLIDEVDTEAGEENLESHSSAAPDANFAEISDEQKDISAKLRDLEEEDQENSLDNDSGENLSSESVNAEIENMLSDMSDLIAAAKAAAVSANEVAFEVQNAAQAALSDPTAENLAAAERIQSAANIASIEAANAAKDLEVVIAQLSEAADAANETVDTTDAEQALNDANTASENAADAATASEAVTDNEIAEMVEHLSDLTDSANLAAQQANNAAVEANNAVIVADANPTPENLEEAENAQETANIASITATNAANELADAIKDLNIMADAAGEIVDTTAASDAVINANDASSAAVAAAIAAEIESDAEIADMVADLSDLTDAANDAANAAQNAAQAANTAAQTADANPTPENLANAEAAQESATTAANDAVNAANTLEEAITQLNAAADAAEETVDTTAAEEAVINANNASTAANESVASSESVTDAEIADMVADLSDLTDAANDAANAAQNAAQAANTAAQTADANPTPENLANAEAAQESATTAANDAVNAANTLEEAITQLNAAADAAEETVDTTAAEEAVINANNASTAANESVASSESVTDAEIADMVADVHGLTNIANVAAQNANVLADEASEAVKVANENPSLENLNNAQTAQEAAAKGATNSVDAASNLESALTQLNEAATAANEGVNPELITAANSAIDNADNSADYANQIANANLKVSTIVDSDVSDNTINENVTDGTYTGVTLNAVDVDGEAVTYNITEDVPFRVEEDGRVVVDGDNAIDYETNGSFTFDVTATSADGTVSTQSVTVDVANVNEAPVITDAQTVSIEEDSLEGFSGYGDEWSGNVYSVITQAEMLDYLNISDADSSELSVTLANTDDGSSYHHGLQATDSTFSNPTENVYDEQVVQVTQGFLDTYPQIDAQVGDFYFDNVAFDSLAEGESANISFGVVVSDGELTSEVKTVNIEVQGSNEAPVITVIDTTATEDIAQVIANVSDIDGTIDASSLSAENGEVTIAENGDITYTPNANYNGVDTVNISVTDSNGATTTQTLSVDVASVNDSVTAADDTTSGIIINETGTNGALVLDSTGTNPELLGGATSVDVTMSLSGEANQGQASLLSYASSGSNNEFLVFSNGANILLYLDGGNVNSGISANELFDGELHELSISWDSATGKAEFYLDGNLEGTQTIAKGHTIDSNGVLMLGQEQDTVGGGLDSNQTFSGEYQDVSISVDGIPVAHWDMNGISEEGTVVDSVGNFDMNVVGDVTISEQSISVNEDTALTITAESLLANDVDIDGDTLSITEVRPNADTHGTVSLDADGNILFTPDANYNGEASFTYTVSDGNGFSDTATVTLNVDSVNDVITQVTDTDTGVNAVNENVAEGTYTGITLNAVDADGDAVTYSVADGVPFSVNENGEVVTSGEIDFETNPSYTFDVTATSADGTVSTQSVTVDVANVNEIDENVTQTQETVTTTTEVIDVEANEAAGIYERDGHYFQTHETGAIDVVALRAQGYTIDSSGNFFEINNDAPKILVEQEVQKEVTKVIEIDEPIMKIASETTTYTSLGESHIDNGGVVAGKSSVDFDFAEPTSNIEIDFADFDKGTAKISFYDANGDQVGSSINQSNINGAVGLSVPDGAVGVSVKNNSNAGSLEVESISYRGSAQEVTVEAGGMVPDYEAMEAAGISWSETVSETVVQTADISNIGNVGNNQIDGFNPESHGKSQVFDFGPELANRMVTITVDMEVKGSWDNNATSTNDYFSVSANGKEIDVNFYSSTSRGHESEDVTVISSRGTDISYTYDVYLDENGQVELDFMVASTATDEVVNIENIEVAYEGQTGWVQEVTDTEMVTQSVLVDAPAEQVDASEIPGGVPMVTQEVEVDPIMTTETTTETINVVEGSDGDDRISFDMDEHVDGGEGLDTLVIEEDMSIDFSGLSDNISNIENIDLGEGTQEITSLSVNDVLDMTDTDNLLRIDGELDTDGNKVDSINLNTQGDDAEWTLGDFKTDAETGATYQEVTGVENDQTVTLEISTDITIDQS